MKKFMKNAVFTAAVSFTLIAFSFVLLYALVDDSTAQYERKVFFSYMLGKFACILLFSVSLGFINRIFEYGKMKAFAKRAVHFILCSLSYLLFMVLLFLTMFESDTLDAKKAISLYLVFFVFYLICVFIRKPFTKANESKEYKSMFDNGDKIDPRPIGIFDSGVGGISILAKLRKEFPHENFIYFGDSANAPFGTKTNEELISLCENIVSYFKKKNCKAIVIACNTATCATLDALKKSHPEIEFIGTSPAIPSAAKDFAGKNVLLLATPFTVQSDLIKNLLEEYQGKANFCSVGCDGLMEFVERGELHGEALENHISKLIAPYKDIPFDAVILGCTHYPFVREAIMKVIGRELPYYDGSEKCIETLSLVLKKGLAASPENKGSVAFSSSAKSSNAVDLMKSLLKNYNA